VYTRRSENYGVGTRRAFRWKRHPQAASSNAGCRARHGGLFNRVKIYALEIAATILFLALLAKVVWRELGF